MFSLTNMFKVMLRAMILVWSLVVLTLGGAGLFGRAATSELIAFMSNRRLNPEIYVQDVSRFLSVQVTEGSAWADTPAWSSDGRLAYAANSDGNWEIYILNMLTGKTVNATQNSERNDYSPAWSVDGRLAFVSVEPNRFGQIYVLDTKSGLLTNTEKFGMTPTWSVDGRLAFASNWSGNWEIYVYDLEADRAVNVSNHRNDDWSPAWSREGRLAYMSNRSGNADIYILDLESGVTVDVTNHEADDLYPKWSADGRLVFMSSRAGNAEIFILDLKTGLATNVTNSLSYDTSPAWMW